MALTLKNRIESELHIVMPIASFLEDHSVKKLAGILYEKIDLNSKKDNLVEDEKFEEGVI